MFQYMFEHSERCMTFLTTIWLL